jgi:two-component system, cell cycle sensor histidine kinase and response regulator CckA
MSRAAEPRGVPNRHDLDQSDRPSASGKATSAAQSVGTGSAARPQRAVEASPLLEPGDEHLRSIFASHPSAIVLVDGSGRIAFLNERTVELTGYAPEELRGQSVDVLVPNGTRRHHAHDRAAYMADPQPRPMGEGRDLSIRRKDGVDVPVEIGLSSFKSGDETYVVAVVADITARKRSEEALANSMSNLQELVAASPLATMMLDLDGRVMLWSPAAEDLFGWRANEVLGRVLPHVPPSELPEVREVLRRVGRGEVISGMELRRQNKEGRSIQAELYAAPQRDAAGHIIGVIEQMADITTRRQVEEALLQTQKMESIGRLAGGVAHDFNNMLTAISGFAQLLIQDLPPGTQEHENAEAIRRAASQAASLTQQLLAFSRRQVLQPRILDPNETVRGMEPMLRRLIGENVDLGIHLHSSEGRIRADPAQLEQIVLNLTVNARDAMPNGGRLTIETGRAVFDTAYTAEHFAVNPGDYLMLAVSDTGIGMDRATRAHVFEPFFTTKERGKGTGLGLATIYGVVRQSGGHIWLYSEPGQGTTFKVYFPVVKDELSEPEVVLPDVAGGTETILLVEDERGVREFAQAILVRKGYTVLAAADPREALAIVESQDGPIDVLVSDVVMPVLSGPELARRVLEARPGIRVLFLSGYTEELIQSEGRLSGMDAFLSKPFTAEDLARKVGEITSTAHAGKR